MLLHDLKDVKNGRVISGQKELTLDEDYGGRTLYVYQLGSTFKGKLHANPTTYPVVSLSTKEEIKKWAKENNFAEVRFMNVTDSKTKDEGHTVQYNGWKINLVNRGSHWEGEAFHNENMRKKMLSSEGSDFSRVKQDLMNQIDMQTNDSKTKDKGVFSPGQPVYWTYGWSIRNAVIVKKISSDRYDIKWNNGIFEVNVDDLFDDKEAAKKYIGDSKTKDQIAELESQKEQAKKMGYGTDAYDAVIKDLQKDAALFITKQGDKYRLIGAIKEQELHDLSVKGFNSYQEALDAIKKYGYTLYRYHN